MIYVLCQNEFQGQPTLQTMRNELPPASPCILIQLDVVVEYYLNDFIFIDYFGCGIMVLHLFLFIHLSVASA